MIMKCYSVRDNNGDFRGVFNDVNDELAKRNFIMAFSHDELMRKFAADFDLYLLGEFDSTTGTLTTEVPVKILDGVSAKLMSDNMEA